MFWYVKGQSRWMALVAWGLILALAACGGTAGQGHQIVSKPGTPRAGLTPFAPSETPGAAGTEGPPLSTLPPRPDPDATVTPGSAGPTPDATLYSRLIYTYTAGIRPVKLVLDILPSGAARATFGLQNRAGVLAPDRMAAIAAALQSANFFSLQDRYIPARTCCDLPGHEITLFTPDGRSKTIEILGHAPDALGPLIEALGGLWRELPLVG